MNHKSFRNFGELGVALLAVAFWIFIISGSNYTCYDFASGMLTEMVGIVITLFFVNKFFEMAQKRIDLESLAWDIMHDTDYAIWVWQGGERVFNLKELKYLVSHISDQDPFPAVTQNIILALGNKASNMLRTNKEIIKINKVFRCGLEELSNLARLRDGKECKPISEVASSIYNAVDQFSFVLNLVEDDNDEHMVIHKDCNEERQIWRHTGQRISPVNFGAGSEAFRRQNRNPYG